MALRFIDGFDHYNPNNASDYADKWSFQSNTAVSTGRFTDLTNAKCISINSETEGMRKDLTARETGVTIFGFAFKTTTTTLSTNMKIFVLWESTTIQVYIRANSDGSFSIVRGDGTVLGTSSTGLWTHSTWYYIEWKIKVADSIGSGECNLYLNGTSILSLVAATDTKNSSNAGWDRVSFRYANASGSTHNSQFDDFYWCDDTGSSNNTVLGDVRVCCLSPNGNGNSSQFVGSDGNSTNNYQLVDEQQANSDTDYVESSTVGNIDTYTFEDLPATVATIKGVQVTNFQRKTDAGTRTVANVTRISSTNYVGSDMTLNANYRTQTTLLESSPATGIAWTVSELNAAEFGPKVTA
jgi:hypothetical protein